MRISKPGTSEYIQCKCGDDSSFCYPYTALFIDPDYEWVCSRCAKCHTEIKIIKLGRLNFPDNSNKKDNTVFSLDDYKKFKFPMKKPEPSILDTKELYKPSPPQTNTTPPKKKGWFWRQ